MTDRYYDWKFRKNPFGSSISLLAEDADGRVAAIVSAWPYAMAENGVTLPAYQGGDTMVHPAFRRRGLFTTLTKAIMAEIYRLGGRVRFSFPGAMSYPGYVAKTGHHLVGYLPLWWRPRLARSVRTSDDSLRPFDPHDPSLEEAFAAYNRSPGMKVAKSAAYLQWRYLDHPRLRYRLSLLGDPPKAVLVLRGGFLIDLIPFDAPDGAALRSLRRALRGERLIQAWMTSRHPAVPWLRGAGFIPWPWRWRPRFLMPMAPLVAAPDPALGDGRGYLDPDRWVLAMGDVDYL